MSSFHAAIILLSINVGLLWLLMAVPLGTRTVRLRRQFHGTTEVLWQAVNPAGVHAAWHHSVLSSAALEDQSSVVEQTYAYVDRNGEPVRRTFAIEELNPGDGVHAYVARVLNDSTLDNAFWRDYSERREVRPVADGVVVEVEQTDRYRGLAFFLFRYFVLRREMAALQGWLDTGQSKRNGYFERPSVQAGLAVLSTLLLWPFMGLTMGGLMISSFLTIVIVLHELGHMAAYRTFGHSSVRMIFVPLLGGVAIGGRPYASRFEVATCALMGPGMSAFFVPILIVLHQLADADTLPNEISLPVLIFLLILGGFNLLNLLPMYRFDGGQVLRQIYKSNLSQLAGSFGITLVILWIGWTIHLPSGALLAGLAVVTLLSLIGARSVKQKHALPDMTAPERLLMAFGLYAAVVIHGYAILYAMRFLF